VPSEQYVMVDDVAVAEDAARHAGLVSITEVAGSMELRFNNGVLLAIRAEGVQIIETLNWRPTQR